MKKIHCARSLFIVFTFLSFYVHAAGPGRRGCLGRLMGIPTVSEMMAGITQENVNRIIDIASGAIPRMVPGFRAIIDGVGAPLRAEVMRLVQDANGQLALVVAGLGVAVRDQIRRLIEQDAEGYIALLAARLRAQMNAQIADTVKHLRQQLWVAGGGLSIMGTASVAASYAAYKTIKKHLYEPVLIEKQSSLLGNAFRKPIALDEAMVVSDTLKNDLNYITKMTANIKKNGGTFENILMYGPPGTGKTLFGKYLAQNSGMNFALIPAANVSQFLTKGTAVEELNNLFAWAEKSSKGTIIFFDEIETLIGDRTAHSEQAEHAVGLLKAKTGTPSSKICIIGATNFPNSIPDAMHSRFGLKLEFGLPDEKSRQKQIEMNIKKVFQQNKSTKAPTINYDYLKSNIKKLASETEDFSGRELQQLMNRTRHMALAQDKLTIDPQLVNDIIKKTRENKARFSRKSSPADTNDDQLKRMSRLTGG